MRSFLTTTPSWGPRGRIRVGTGEEWRWMEVDGGDFGGGEGEGRVGAIPFYFPQPLAFFGFSPHNFLIRAKMNKSKKRDQRWNT